LPPINIIFFWIFIVQIYNIDINDVNLKLSKKIDNGIIITLDEKDNSAKKVRLEVINDRIIRISATAEYDFRDQESLIIVEQKTKPFFVVSEDEDKIKVFTSSIIANVQKNTGEISFTDKQGNIILREQIGGGKIFTPYSCEQTHSDGKQETYHGWTTQSIFESPDNEAFFGLGQHQADEWNYKGRNEELFQYNTKVSIPFIVSSKNYGILFDTYSFCRFGNPLPYSELKKVFNLYDKYGKEGALTGTYKVKGEDDLVRREESINYEDYLYAGENLPKIDLANSIVYFEGQIEPLETGEYKFNHY